jgi:ribosome-binding factor A
MANPRTIARLEARILERAAHCIEHELADPRVGMITLTKVELANDLGSAKVHWSVLGGDSERRLAQRVLDDAAGYIQRQVGRVLETRKIPRLSFLYDDSIARAAELDRKIKEALAKDRELNPHAHDDLLAAGVDLEVEPTDETTEIEREYEEFLEDEDEPK